MFNIKSLEYLTSQIGEGLKIGNSTFCCARITEIELPEGATLKQVAEADGLALGYTVEQPSDIVPNQPPTVKFNTTDLSDANNYVLVIQDEEGNGEIVTSGVQVTRLFNLPDEDGEKLMLHIDKLAKSRNLAMLKTETLEGKPLIFFTNAFDEGMMDAFMENDNEAALKQLSGLMRATEYLSELQNHNFIKMFLVGLIKSSQDRYNKLYRDDVLFELAKRLCEIKYWEDGKLLSPSMKDIESYFDAMKSQIVVH